jgi:HPt (histidine-containing phosphotransfer) domain-containing protein
VGRQLKQVLSTQTFAADDALVFDRLRFETNTMFDASLQNEILGLFQSQIEQMEARLSQGAVTAEDHKFLGHTLRGAAASVGALELEDIGANWERLSLAGHDLVKVLKLAEQRFNRATQSYKV